MEKIIASKQAIKDTITILKYILKPEEVIHAYKNIIQNEFCNRTLKKVINNKMLLCICLKILDQGYSKTIRSNILATAAFPFRDKNKIYPLDSVILISKKLRKPSPTTKLNLPRGMKSLTFCQGGKCNIGTLLPRKL